MAPGRAAAISVTMAVFAGAAVVHWRRRRRKSPDSAVALAGPPPDEWRDVARTILANALTVDALEAEEAPPARIPPATCASLSEVAVSVLYEIHASMPCRVEACAVPPAPEGAGSAMTDAESSDGASLSDGSTSHLSSRTGSPVSSRLGSHTRAFSSTTSSLAGDSSPRASRSSATAANRPRLAAGGATHPRARPGSLQPARSPRDVRDGATPLAMSLPRGTPPPARGPPSTLVSNSQLVPGPLPASPLPAPPNSPLTLAAASPLGPGGSGAGRGTLARPSPARVLAASHRLRMKPSACARRAAAAAAAAAATGAAAAASEALSPPRLAEAASALRLILALQQAEAADAQSTLAAAPSIPQGEAGAPVPSALPLNVAPPGSVAGLGAADRTPSAPSATAAADAGAAAIAALSAHAQVPPSDIYRLQLCGRLMRDTAPNPDLGSVSVASPAGSYACKSSLAGLSAAASPLPGTVRALNAPASGGRSGPDASAGAESPPDHAVLCWGEARAVVLVVGRVRAAGDVGGELSSPWLHTRAGGAARECGASDGGGGSSGESGDGGGRRASASTRVPGLRSEASSGPAWRDLPPSCLLPSTGFCSGRAPAALAAATRALWAAVSPAVFRALRVSAGSELIIMGHGLAGGVAGLLAVMIRHESLVLPCRAPRVRCLAYAPPPVFGPVVAAAPPPAAPWPATPRSVQPGAASSTPPSTPCPAALPSASYALPSGGALHDAVANTTTEPTGALRAMQVGLHSAVGDGVTAFIVGDDCVPFYGMDTGRRLRAAVSAVEAAVRAVTGEGECNTAAEREAEGVGAGGQAEGWAGCGSEGGLGHPASTGGQGHLTTDGFPPALPARLPPASPPHRYSTCWLGAIGNSPGRQAAPTPAELAASGLVRQAALQGADSVEPTRRAPRLCIPASVVVWIRPAAAHAIDQERGGAGEGRVSWQRGVTPSSATAAPPLLGAAGRGDTSLVAGTGDAQQQNNEQDNQDVAAPPVFGPAHTAYACGPVALAGLGVRLTPRMTVDHSIGSYAAALGDVAGVAEGPGDSEAARRVEAAPLGGLAVLPAEGGACGVQTATLGPSREEGSRLRAGNVAGGTAVRDALGKRDAGPALGCAAHAGLVSHVPLLPGPPLVVPLGLLPAGRLELQQEEEARWGAEVAPSTPHVRPSGYVGDRSGGGEGRGSCHTAGSGAESRRRRLRYGE